MSNSQIFYDSKTQTEYINYCVPYDENAEPYIIYKVDNENVTSFVYNYYTDGNQRTKIDMINNVITAYTYDGAGQLRSERKTGAVVSADIYWYDASGNRTLKNEYRPNADGNLTSRFIRNTYNSMNQLIESVDSETGEVTSYTYDEYGNLESDETYEYWYDSDYNRLYRAKNLKTGEKTYYEYYYDGLRKSKGNTFYIWLDGNMVYEFTSSDSNTYTYGHRLLYSDDYKYVLNAHGDVVALLNGSGETVKEYDYDAFGSEPNIDTTDTNPFRYCAEYFDKEYGQIYLRNRYYLPVVGRFTQLDPIKDGLNWYAYCGNNPVVFVDPSGLDSIIITADHAAFNQGHTSILVQDTRDGEWYYFYWGDKAVYFVEVPNENGTLDSLYAFNDWLNNQNLPYSTKNYTSSSYVEGDFNNSVDFFKALVNDVTIERGIKLQAGEFDKPTAQYYQINKSYDLLTANCLHMSMEGFYQGTLNDGTNVGDFMAGQLNETFLANIRPNSAEGVFKQIFSNQYFTKMGARAYISFIESINAYSDKYNSKSQMYASGIRGGK